MKKISLTLGKVVFNPFPSDSTLYGLDLVNHPPHDYGLKFDSEKTRYELITPEFERLLAQVLTHGAKKYGDRNWEKGINYSRIMGAIRRHLHSFSVGENIDKESGLSHLAHAACGVMFLLTYQERNMIQFDDIPTRGFNEEA